MRLYSCCWWWRWCLLRLSLRLERARRNLNTCLVQTKRLNEATGGCVDDRDEEDGTMQVIDARAGAARMNALFYQHIPAMGLRNYWHPVALSREITDQPLPRTLMGDAVILLRRQEK